MFQAIKPLLTYMGLIQVCCPLFKEEAQNKDPKRNLTVFIYLISGINQTSIQDFYRRNYCK